MKRIIILLLIAALGWYSYGKYQERLNFQNVVGTKEKSSTSAPPSSLRIDSPSGSVFKCDGRTYCSQMTSCAEATFFLQNCPGTKMDGNNDGIPCEKQWCK